MDKIISILEEESLFLPNLVARLAEKKLIKHIIIYRKPFKLNQFKSKIREIFLVFGFKTGLNLFLSVLLAQVSNFLFKNRYYSIKKVSSRFDIPFTVVNKLNSKRVSNLIERLSPDIVFAQVGALIKSDLLQGNCFWNKHCSLLPSYKGVYPVFWGMLNNEPYLGVTIHRMDESFDTGPILSQSAIPNKSLTFFDAYHKLYDVTGELIIELLLHGKKHNSRYKACSSYYSFPDSSARREFLKNNKFGFPFRLHPYV